MPVIDALILISARVEKLRKYDEPPPGRIGSVMRIIADGRMATLLEVEQVIEWLEEKRVKLGGRKRTYQSMIFFYIFRIFRNKLWSKLSFKMMNQHNG